MGASRMDEAIKSVNSIVFPKANEKGGGKKKSPSSLISKENALSI
jgi:hypothetical protein